MKAILFLTFLCAAWAAENGYPTVPTSEFDCGTKDPSLDWFYPHPLSASDSSNCVTFYRCVPGHGLAYRYTCNDANEVFEEEYQMCVNTWDAFPPCGTNAGTSVPPTGTTGTTTENPNPFYCDNLEDGYYANPVSCNSFFICNNDVPDGHSATPVPCPAGLVYNPEQFYCDWPYNVPPPCGTKVTKYDGPACEDSERFECNGATSVVGDADCVTFYNCDVNIQRVCPSKCPPGLVYNLAAGYCDYSYNVAPPCGTKVTRAEGPACDDSERYECNGATSVVVDADCVTFYNCDVNIQRVCPSKCPPGLVFNKDIGMCDWPYNVAAPCGTA